MVILIALAAFVSTLCGGLLALKFKDKLHLILGFSAGAVIGVAFFDLLPESISLGSKFYDIVTITSITAAGFLIYLVLDRLVFLHAHAHGHEPDHRSASDDLDEQEHQSHLEEIESKKISRGILGAGSLSIHSFLDGVAIGLAFQVSAVIGAIVAIAVLVHDFSDGINTVNMILKNKGEGLPASQVGKSAFKWLIVDALAPVLGAASTLFFSLPEKSLSVVLAIFAGFFLYIGASDLIPESHHAHPKFLTTAMTLLGAAVLFTAVHFANI
jgi:ZIP family zinc transporter